jgi:hypothetical protein
MAKRILVRNHGPIEENVVKALAAAIKVARQADVKVIHLIVPAKSSFDGTVVSDVLGNKITASLLNDKIVTIKDNISIKLESAETVKNSMSVRVALATYLGARDLRIIDGLGNVKAIVFLPWVCEDGEGWQQSWGAEVFGEKLKESPLDLHPELEKNLLH